MLCFSIFSLGYLIVGLAGLPVAAGLVAAVGVKTWTLVGLIVAAVGGSLIKPSIVGTCARTTTEESRALGYSIYYSMVNVGGMLGPTLAVPIRENLGIAWVLVVASIVSAVLCFGDVPVLHRAARARPICRPPSRSARSWPGCSRRWPTSAS